MSNLNALLERLHQVETNQEFVINNLVEQTAKLNGLIELLVISNKLSQAQLEELEVLAEANKEKLMLELLAIANDEELPFEVLDQN